MPHFKSWVSAIGGRWNWSTVRWVTEPYNPHPPDGGEVIIGRILSNLYLNIDVPFFSTEKVRWLLSPFASSYPQYIYDTYLNLTVNPHYFESYNWQTSSFEMELLAESKPLTIMCQKIEIIPVTCYRTWLKFDLRRSTSRSIVLVVPAEKYLSFLPNSEYEFDFFKVETKYAPADDVRNLFTPQFQFHLIPEKDVDDYFIISFALELPSSSPDGIDFGLLSEDTTTWSLGSGSVPVNILTIKDKLSFSNAFGGAQVGSSMLVQLSSPFTQSSEIDYGMRISNLLISEDSSISQGEQISYVATFRVEEDANMEDTPAVRMLGDLLLKTETTMDTESADSVNITRGLNILSHFTVLPLLGELRRQGGLTLWDNFALTSTESTLAVYSANIQDGSTLLDNSIPSQWGVWVKDDSTFSFQGVTALPTEGTNIIKHNFSISNLENVAAIFPLSVLDTSLFNLSSVEWELWRNLIIMDESILTQTESILTLPILDVVDVLDFMWTRGEPTSIDSQTLQVTEMSDISQHATNIFQLLIRHTTHPTPVGGWVDYIIRHALNIGELSYWRGEDAVKLHYAQQITESCTLNATISPITYLHYLLFSEHYVLQQGTDSVKEQTALVLRDEASATDYDNIIISGTIVVHEDMPPHQDAVHTFIWQPSGDEEDAEGPAAV